jgi:hypothetical protein
MTMSTTLQLLRSPARAALPLAAEPPVHEAVVRSLNELVTSGDAGALRWLEDKVERLPEALAELTSRPISLADLEDRLAELRERMRQAQEDLERASYRADVVEVQATLLSTEEPAPRAGKASRTARKAPGRTHNSERRRLEHEAAELRALCARRERELQQHEDEHALVLALAATRMAVGQS